jgi:hypothetical protein
LSEEKSEIRFLISDFDGTITNLDVDWKGLRERLSVSSIEELLLEDFKRSWLDLKKVEINGVTAEWASIDVRKRIANVESFSILTNNDKEAVSKFFDLQSEIAEKPTIVIDRNFLGGSKKNFKNFSKGIDTCLTHMHCGNLKEVVYLGDSNYEIEFAEQLGLFAIQVYSGTKNYTNTSFA